MSSHRQILQSSAVIGSATAINILIGVTKVKFLALLLGPTGVGLMGFYQNILNAVVKLASCGTDSSGVRQVAALKSDAELRQVVRRALLFGNLALGTGGMLILWILREPVSQWVFGDASQAGAVGWLGFGLLVTLLAGSQMAYLQGMRRIGDIAKVTILGAFASAAGGLLAVYLFGVSGVVWFVVAAPIANAFAASYFAARLPRHTSRFDLNQTYQQWLAMLKLGIPFMTAGLLMLVTQLAARSIILRELGIDASGFFQASLAISVTYVALILNSMAIDFFPRLTAAMSSLGQARRLVNEQAETGLLLAGPALIAMITLAPWVIRILYAESFSPAAEVLTWQVLGDIFKVASWPLGYIFLASGRGGIYIGIQIVWSVAYLGSLLLGLEEAGLAMAGKAYGIANFCLFVVVAMAARTLISFRPTKRNSVLTVLLFLVGILIIIAFQQSIILGYVTGLTMTVLLGVYSIHRLNQLVDLADWIRSRVARK